MGYLGVVLFTFLISYVGKRRAKLARAYGQSEQKSFWTTLIIFLPSFFFFVSILFWLLPFVFNTNDWVIEYCIIFIAFILASFVEYKNVNDLLAKLKKLENAEDSESKKTRQ
jgi:hypothetical protein